MEEKTYILEQHDSSHITKVFQIVLGILCIGISIYWIIFNIKSIEKDFTLWITIAFLICFGIYQILAGSGKTKKYITIGANIKLKQNLVLPPVLLKPEEIGRIELYPINIIFKMKRGGSIKLRFGVTYTDIIQPVKDEIILFAQKNNLNYEEIQEEI